MAPPARPRDIERDVYRLERMDHDIERGDREVERARVEARQARQGIISDALYLSIYGYLAYTFSSTFTADDWPLLALGLILALHAVAIPWERFKTIRDARKKLRSKRERISDLRSERVIHVRRLEDLGGGVSLVEGPGGELTQAD